MTRVLITGVSGLLGINFALQIADQHQVFGVYQHKALQGTPFKAFQADLTVPGEVEKVFELTNPELVINCAAMANLDRCEQFPVLAEEINTHLPARLARLARLSGARLVHISTDAVFDGLKGAYREGDAANPACVYAHTKYEGEVRVQQENPQALIARVNFYGSSISGKRSLAEWFYNNLKAQQPMMGFIDVFFCPLFVDHLVEKIWQMAEKELSGVYHVVGSECLSKYDFGVSLARLFDLDETLITPASWHDAGLKVARSPNLCLDTSRVQAALGESMPGLMPGLLAYKKKVEQGYPEQVKAFLANEKEVFHGS